MPHFHVRFAEGEAIIEIETKQISKDPLPAPIRRAVVDWGARHRTALLENWRRAMEHEPLIWIEPPE